MPDPTPTPSTTQMDTGPVFDDDPAAAALVLLSAREGCVRDLSVECLDAVDQAGSSALAADRELIASILAGAETGDLLVADGAQIVQRLGDSALVRLEPQSQPASLLLVKSEAGWRIRDYLEQQPG